MCEGDLEVSQQRPLLFDGNVHAADRSGGLRSRTTTSCTKTNSDVDDPRSMRTLIKDMFFNTVKYVIDGRV